MSKDFILGTAGHIDHGKTSLIRALTGAETDRLPEEQKRGITIELGYAHLEIDGMQFGIVDVPGHEKFVRQMLCGATGMDIAMLIVAADDSINQQTREHFDILRLLEIPAGIVALTKCDTVDEGWLDLVEEEIQSFVKGSIFEGAPIVRTSAVKKTGIEDLREAIRQAAEKVETARQDEIEHAPFRMAIDRCFTMEGHGTVITGSVGSGQAKLGDQLTIEPGNVAVRIRALQNHDSQVDSVQKSQRAAINVGGIHHNEIERGQEICSPEHLSESRLLTLKLDLLASCPRPLKDRQLVRFHVGTSEILGNVRLLGCKTMDPGSGGFVQIFLNEPCVSVWGQPFVIRSESPVATIGGGKIVDPNADPIKKPDETDLDFVSKLNSRNPVERISASAYFGRESWQEKDLPRKTGISDYRSMVDELVEEGTLLRIQLSHTRVLMVHSKTIERIANHVVSTLEKLHGRNPLLWSIPRTEIRSQFQYLENVELLNEAIKVLKSQKRIRLTPDSIGLEGHGPKLSKAEQHGLTELQKVICDAKLAPPLAKEMIKSFPKIGDSVLLLLDLACQSGRIVKLTDDLFLGRETLDEIKGKLRESMSDSGNTMSEIRELLETSRKYALPLCEFLDKEDFTRRDGDLRFLTDKAKVD